MQNLFAIVLILVGLMFGVFSHAWSGEIAGQVLRTVSGGKEIPVEAAGIFVYQHVPGMSECKSTDSIGEPIFTDSDGVFSRGALKAGLYQICVYYDYFADDDPDQFNRRVEVSLAKRVRVSQNGVTKVTFKK